MNLFLQLATATTQSSYLCYPWIVICNLFFILKLLFDYQAIRKGLPSIYLLELCISDVNLSWTNIKEALLWTERKHYHVIYQKQLKTLLILKKNTKRIIDRKARAWKRYNKDKTKENWQSCVKAWNFASNVARKLKFKHEQKLAGDIC